MSNQIDSILEQTETMAEDLVAGVRNWVDEVVEIDITTDQYLFRMVL